MLAAVRKMLSAAGSQFCFGLVNRQVQGLSRRRVQHLARLHRVEYRP